MIRVFLVEDQPALLKSLAKALSTYGDIELVGTEQDGERAVSSVLKERPDVLLLDLELPSMHGIEVTRRVKQASEKTDVLVLTSFDDEQKVYEAIQAGASGYLVKRVGPDKIHQAILEVAQGGTVIEPLIAKRFWNYFQSVRSGGEGALDDVWGLTPLERDLLQYIAKGLSNAEVAQVMSLERRTVRTHLSHVYRKMGVNTHVDAVVAALKRGLIQL